MGRYTAVCRTSGLISLSRAATGHFAQIADTVCWHLPVFFEDTYMAMVTVQIWDATPLTPELLVLREARSIVEFLTAQKLPDSEMISRIRREPAISDAVRTRALSLLPPGPIP